MNLISDDQAAIHAAAHLSAHDSKLAPVIQRFGTCTIRPHTDYYKALVDSIIGQQLSVKAAASIRTKFIGLFSDDFPSPGQLLEKTIDELRTAGLSRAKALYIQDLAQHVLDNKLEFSRFDQLSNEAIITELLAVKGVGEWTAHMFLMFCMGRSDVLPAGDLGIRNGIQKLYGLTAIPDKSTIEAIATKNHWHPYESVACWYVWQSLDNEPVAST